MIDVEDNLYKNTFAAQASIGMIKLMNKLEKIKEREQEEYKPKLEEYYKSDYYKKLQEQISKQSEDDEFKFDADPKGYELYKQCVSAY